MNPATLEPVDISGPHTPFFEQLYQQLNPQGLPETNPGTAAQFLKASNIDVVYLSQIWELADYRRVGSLDKRGAYIAFKLVAGVQQGLPLQPGVITSQLAQPPQFNIASQPPPTSFQRSNSVLSQSPSIVSSGGPVSPSQADWDIDLTEQKKYDAIFQSLNPVNGRLSGEAVRPILLNSQLPNTHLAKIWELSDIDKDGQLDRYEMYVALHLVYKCLQNAELPDRLPVSLVHPAKRSMLGAMAGGVAGPVVINQPMSVSRRTSWANSGPGGQRMSLNLNSRTSSITSLNNSGIPNPPSKPATPIGALTPGFKSIFEDKDAPCWPIDATKYEADFRKIDTDYDGLVSGVDAKQLLMSCGLPQHVLAQIWALVDIAHAGRINLEQFSLVLELTNECRHGVRLPEMLPAFLVPPSITNRTMGVSNSSVSLTNNSNGTTPAAAPPSSNPRIIELNEEIEKVMDNRRQAEQELFQLEADTTVKNSEIKNLEIELLTLSATVKQLQHQKGEANKRLAEMDDKISKLEGQCTEHSERVEAEKDRLDKVKLEISQANDNFTAEEEILQSLKEEERKIDEKCAQVKRTLGDKNGKIEQLVDQLTMMERRTDANEKEASRMEKLTAELSELLQKQEKQQENNIENNVEQMDYEELLRHNFQKILLSAEGVVSPVSGRPSKQFDSVDPFKAISGSVDPFEGSDSGYPFGATSTARSSLAATADIFGGGAGKSSSGSEFADFSKFASFGA